MKNSLCGSVAILFLVFCQNSFGQQAIDRVAEYLLEHQSFRENAKFYGSRNVIQDKEAVKELSRKKKKDQSTVLLHEELFQMSINRNKERVDSMLKMGPEGARLNVAFESFLKSTSDMLYFCSNDSTGVSRYPLSKPMERSRPFANARDPFQLATSMFFSATLRNGKSIFLADLKVLEERFLTNGDYYVLCIPSKKAGLEIVFRREPRWAPAELRFYQKEDDTPVDITPQVVKRWNNYATTSVKWIFDLKTERWVPARINYDMNYGPSKASAEYLFGGWDFSDDHKDLFDESRFTTDEIQKDFNSKRCEAVLTRVASEID